MQFAQSVRINWGELLQKITFALCGWANVRIVCKKSIVAH